MASRVCPLDAIDGTYAVSNTETTALCDLLYSVRGTTGNTGATYRIWAMNLSGTAYQYCEGKTVYGVPGTDAKISTLCVVATSVE